MFKAVLVPTDGSDESGKAIEAAIDVAKIHDAKVIGLSVAAPYPFSSSAEAFMAANRAIYDESMKKLAEQNVRKIGDAANDANVPCETLVTQSHNPYEEIIDVASKLHCDLIVMASQGRKSLNKLFIGSETQKVLAHSSTPVLVVR